jgi:hypothetical protein
MAFNRPWGPSSSWDRPSERFDSSSNLPGFEWWKPQNTGENRFMSRDHPGYRGPLADIPEQGITDFWDILLKPGGSVPRPPVLNPWPAPTGPSVSFPGGGGAPSPGPSGPSRPPGGGPFPGPGTEPNESSWVMDFLNWLKGYGKPIVQGGMDIFGSAMQSRAMSQYNDELRRRTELMDRLGGEERQRRDYYAQTLMPNLLRGTGFTPEQSRRRIGEFPTSQV